MYSIRYTVQDESSNLNTNRNKLCFTYISFFYYLIISFQIECFKLWWSFHLPQFGSSLNRPYPSESTCKTFQMKLCLICLKMNREAEQIFIWMAFARRLVLTERLQAIGKYSSATGKWTLKVKVTNLKNKNKENYIRFFEFLKGILIMRQSLYWWN